MGFVFSQQEAYGAPQTKVTSVVATTITMGISVTAILTPELVCGDGAGESAMNGWGGMAIEGGDCGVGWGVSTSMTNLWPFLQ